LANEFAANAVLFARRTIVDVGRRHKFIHGWTVGAATLRIDQIGNIDALTARQIILLHRFGPVVLRTAANTTVARAGRIPQVFKYVAAFRQRGSLNNGRIIGIAQFGRLFQLREIRVAKSALVAVTAVQ